MTPLSPTQAKVAEAMKACGGVKAEAARMLGLAQGTVSTHCRAIRRKGHQIPEAPHGTNGLGRPTTILSDAPPGHRIKGVSSYVDENGAIKGQWIKTDASAAAQQEAMRAFVHSLAESVKGLAKPIKPPKRNFDESLSVYPVGDAHFGMYAWGDECGEDFDTDIASRDLRSAVSMLVNSAPPSRQALLVDVGDSLHIDNRSNKTPQSGNILDVDTRYQRVARILAMTFRYAVRQMLTKHETVRVIIAPGNHNPDSAGWLALCLSMFYENEPRVEIDTSPGYFFYHRFGKSLIGVTHGDSVKPQELPGVMATDRPEDWGASRHRLWLCGHIHHKRQQEFPGCVVETFNTLAARDAWHTKEGYRAARNMQRIDIDADHGIYGRAVVDVGRLC